MTIMRIKQTETDLKYTIKNYLDRIRIFSFPVTQGLGSYRGAPDRVMHYQGKVHYLEIKLPDGRMSDYQTAFQEQCKVENIPYHIIRSLEDLLGVLNEQR